MSPILPALLDALSFVLIFPHISATISEDTLRWGIFLGFPVLSYKNYRKGENTRKHKETPMKVMYDKNNIGLTN